MQLAKYWCTVIIMLKKHILHAHIIYARGGVSLSAWTDRQAVVVLFHLHLADIMHTHSHTQQQSASQHTALVEKIDRLSEELRQVQEMVHQYMPKH